MREVVLFVFIQNLRISAHTLAILMAAVYLVLLLLGWKRGLTAYEIATG